ncbi:MAG: DUF1488 domain-containing protein [Vicinamibacterales bacterium]
MDITFENRRLYVAPRKSVLFFAIVGDQRVRCYVDQDVLIEPVRGLREEADIYQRCLLAFDHHKDLIQATTRRLIAAKGDQLDGELVVSSTALSLEVEIPLPALRESRTTG